ncbi:hypothetical protein POM88_041959 [Heracleum sosnowskyi]|uniref:Helitron helicase-like domain-containing protein n=1 Tax=Heracleum sosnowskyi TaxID=360622 RepID=A0AAD8HGX6_9APIA|nr:hypothetical protein POM88_041959 [Heracleum sosnowskyi]
MKENIDGLRNQGSTLSAKDRRTEPLLSNVFKSKTQKRKPQEEKTNMTNMSPHTPRQNCSNTAAVKSRTPLSPLSTNTLPSPNIKYSPQSHFSPNVPFPSQVPVDLSSYWPKEKVFSGMATKSQNSNKASYLSNKSKGKRPIEDAEMSCRKIGFDESQRIQSTAHHTYDLEDSCFYDFQHEDSDASSEDEDFTADLNYDSYSNQEMPLNVVKDYASLGAPDVQCQHCHAWMWKEERSNKSVTRGIPVFSLCCAKGQIQLPNEEPTPSFIWQLHNDKAKAKAFNDDEGITPRLGGRLYQQYVVDAFSTIEQAHVIARVFRLKLDQMVDDIKSKNYFGVCLGVMYVVEFQKRGLPHVHMLIWLDSSSKPTQMYKTLSQEVLCIYCI